MRSIFPSTYSTLSPLALGEFISEEYGLGEVQCRFLTRGVGDTYLIEAGSKRFIVRVYRSSHRTIPQISAEIALLSALRAADVPVSYPVRDSSGEAMQVIEAVEGQRYAVLFTYAPGKSMRTLNEEQLLVFGHEMARFHTISSSLELGSARWVFDTETTLSIPLQLLEDHFAEIPDEYSWLQQAAGQVVSRLERVDTAVFSSGYCHFDFLPKNFHFEENKITFFDFDFMGYGWLINDIMTYWQHLQLDVYAGRMKKETADEMYSIFLSGYRKQRMLSEEEVQFIPYLTLGFWLFYMGFHTTHDQFYSFLQPTTLKGYTGFLQHLAKQYWKS